MNKPSPFDYVKAINEKKEIDNHSLYNPFLANIAFSYALDSILPANEMNMHARLPAECQFDFLYSVLPQKRRFSKWYKEDKHPHLEAVMEYYGYSKNKALEALNVLTQENIRDILKMQESGGR